jgi:ribose/xylose/arabinose/galactoside ABC-type transport system permease subunit
MATGKLEGPTDAQMRPRRSGMRHMATEVVERYGILLALLALCVVLAFLSPYFLTVPNFLNVLLQASINLVVAVGMTFVITSAGIDLSVGSIVALAGIIMALLMKNHIGGLPVAVLGALVAGLAVGSSNGMLITRLRLPPFIVTLGTMSVVRGLALIISDGKPVYGLPQAELRVISGYIGPVPIPVIIAIIVAILAHLVLRRTTMGEYTVAIGGNEEAARLSGIDVRNYKVAIYAISGLMCGIAGIILTSRLSAAEPIAGVNYELDAIAATVMGGTSLMGGQGTIFGTVIGALLMSVLRNGLNLLNIQSYYQQLAIGIVIILAVSLDVLRKR